MKFLWTTIIVKNLEESLHFYQEIVGLKLNRRFQAGPEKEFAFLGEGDTEIELICDSNCKMEKIGQGISLGFKVASLDEKMTKLKEKGIILTTDVIQPNPHVKFFFVNDPNGLDIQFVEQMK